ncbi:hypothetical protein GN244_ATG20873 [Phytophthora infestans]|uniref:Uncharacterized protein n=1 Tax=Phytophthora infestans TaxID=4787 RepID=A0A833SIC4_PHYIN|nr:hypothetical protein GN244_ATG20873 [Phytophthora infestans]
METRKDGARQAPPSPIKRAPLKIHTQEYVDTPSSSTTASPAESCAAYVEKQLKPWERSASVASSVNSSETSEVLDDTSNEAQKGESVRSITEPNDEKANAQALKMQSHLLAMQMRLNGLQRLVEEAAFQNRLRSCSQDFVPDTQSHFVPAAEANEGARDDTDLQRDAEPTPKESVNESDLLGSKSSSDSVEGAPNDEANDSRDDLQDSSSSSSEDDGHPAIATLLKKIKALQTQLKEATDENQQLQSTVNKLEKENERLQAQTEARVTDVSCDKESNDAEGAEACKHRDESLSRLTLAIFGEPSAFQMVMEEDLAVLKNHERCQHKLHELWDTIRKLRTFVETYELERNALRIQRDDAVADADRADAENVKLASSSNPQQKIKYLQQVKKDNQALRRKNRALNMRIANQAAKYVREKNGCSLLQEECETTIDTTLGSMTLDDTLIDEPALRTGEEILQSMRNRSEILEQRLESLRLAKQELPEDDDTSSEVIGQRPPATRAR